MKFFPLKTAIFCLLFTPILYIATLSVYQKYVNNHYLQEIENIFIGDTSILLEGRVPIDEQIAKNIYTFLKTDWMVQYIGLDLKVFVTTHKGKLIYPTFINADAFANSLPVNSNFEGIAKQNFEILNDDLTVSVEINLNHGSNIANLILLVYFSVAVLIFFIYYNVGSLRASRDTKAKKALIDDLQKEEQAHQQILEDLKKERQGLFENIKSLNAKYQKDKKKLKINEEEMFDEIISLEEQLNVMAGYISRDNHIILILSAGPNGAALKYILVDGQLIEQAYINDELVNLTTTDYRMGSYETAVVKIPYTGDQASVIIVYGGGSVEVFVKKI